MSEEGGKKPRGGAERESREARLAEALRANLRKRKAQARVRSQPAEPATQPLAVKPIKAPES